MFKPYVDAAFDKLKLPPNRGRLVYDRVCECLDILSSDSIVAKESKLSQVYKGTDLTEKLWQFDERKKKLLPELANRLVNEAARDSKHRILNGLALPPAEKIVSGAFENKKSKNKLKGLTDTNEVRGCWARAQ